jgi:hypothetical protein
MQKDLILSEAAKATRRQVVERNRQKREKREKRDKLSKTNSSFLVCKNIY